MTKKSGRHRYNLAKDQMGPWPPPAHSLNDEVPDYIIRNLCTFFGIDRASLLADLRGGKTTKKALKKKDSAEE